MEALASGGALVAVGTVAGALLGKAIDFYRARNEVDISQIEQNVRLEQVRDEMTATAFDRVTQVYGDIINRLREEVDQLKEENRQLRERVQHLEAQNNQ